MMRRLAIASFVVGANVLIGSGVSVAQDPGTDSQPSNEPPEPAELEQEAAEDPKPVDKENQPSEQGNSSPTVSSDSSAVTPTESVDENTEPLPSAADLFVDEDSLGDDLGIEDEDLGINSTDPDPPKVDPEDEEPVTPRLFEWQLRLETGGGFDTNVYRTERIESSSRITASPLLSLGAQADGVVRRRRWLGMFRAGASARLFGDPDSQAESVGVAKLDAQGWRALGRRGAQLGLRGSFFNASAVNANDAIEDQLGRNFLTANGEMVASLPGPGPDRVIGAIGYRSFVYKPNDSFSWRGQSARMTYRRTFWLGDDDPDDTSVNDSELTEALESGSVDASLTYSLGLRGYTGPAIANVCAPSEPISPLCFMATTRRRRDFNHSLTASVVYTGERIYSARYGARLNDSNSFGQSLVRQRLELAVTTEVFRTGVFATAELAVLINHFLDPLLLARDASNDNFDSLDDENRNALSLHASKEVRPRLSLEGRYALFSNEFGSQERPFRRQTFFGGLVYEFQ